MGSKADRTTATETNQLAVDQSNTNDQGLQIFDSIITDSSDEVVIAMLEQHRATFELMMDEQRVDLGMMLGLAKDVMDLADSNSIAMQDGAYEMLRNATHFLDAAHEEGKRILDFNSELSERAYDLSGEALSGGYDTLKNSLEFAAEVSTGNETITTTFTLLTILGLAALYFSTRKG